MAPERHPSPPDNSNSGFEPKMELAVSFHREDPPLSQSRVASEFDIPSTASDMRVNGRPLNHVAPKRLPKTEDDGIEEVTPLTQIRDALEMDFSDNPAAQQAQAALRMAERELVASAGRVRLMNLRIRELEELEALDAMEEMGEVPGRWTGGLSATAGLTTQGALKGITVSREKERLRLEEKDAQRTLREQPKKENAAEGLERMSQRGEKKKQREAKAAVMAAKRAENASQKAQNPSKKTSASRNGKEMAPIVVEGGAAAVGRKDSA